MQTLIPQSASATAKPLGKRGRVFGFGLTPLALLLFAAGWLLAIPAFFHPRDIYFMLGWDGLLLLAAVVDAVLLPKPEALTVTREFVDSPQLGEGTRVELAVRLDAESVLDVRMVDDLHPALVGSPQVQRVEAFPREDAVSVTTVYPLQRGDFALGKVYLRYRGVFKLVERWAVALPLFLDMNEIEPSGAGSSETPRAANTTRRIGSFVIALVAIGLAFIPVHHVWLFVIEALFVVLLLITSVFVWRKGKQDRQSDVQANAVAEAREVARTQRVRVYPAHEDSRESTAFYLLRARQIEMQKRKLRLRGVGRDFDSLRDYQQGDELRNISWTATARRGRLVTRQFTVERSQQVWIVIDAGRLSRTAFELRTDNVERSYAETDAEREARHLLTVTQLDQATTAATMLAQVISGSGDKFGMMAYGRTIQQILPPGAGATHLRLLIDMLSQTKSETAEADSLLAVARLKNMQQRRGMMVWITELVDSAGRPEIVTAAAELVRRHLVVLVVLKHPELDEMAARVPKNRDEMFHAAAAQEMLERRRETLAQLERQGVLIVETTAEEVGVRAVSKYLEVKAEGLL